MTLQYQAAVLHQARSPLAIEQVEAAPLAPDDVLVRIRAAGLCHTDLEVIDGSLRYPMPIVLGHEAAGVIVEAGAAGGEGPLRGRGGVSLEPPLGPFFFFHPGPALPFGGYFGQGPHSR